MKIEKILQQSSISIKMALSALSKSGEKCLIIVDKDKKLLGTLSDGDIRKCILSGSSLDDSIEKIYQRQCTSFVEGNYNPEEIKKIFAKKRFDLIPIIDSNNKVKKIIYWEDFLLRKRRNKRKLNLPVIIMAGGAGTRLAPFTNVLPKPLIPIGDETIIERIIAKFTAVGVDQFFLTINYKSKLLKAFFEELSPKYKINFAEEKEPLGTAGSIYLLRKEIKTPFFVSNCDIIIDSDYSDIYKFHQQNKFDLTLVASAKNYEIPYGTCVLSGGRLESIEEKPSLNYLVNTGLYLINPEVMKLIPKNKYYDMTDLIEEMLSRNMNIGAYTVDEDSWIDIGQWAEYKKALELFS